MNVAQVAKKWGVSGIRVREWLRAGRIPGAYRTNDRNASWEIPDEATPPEKIAPGRKKAPTTER